MQSIMKQALRLYDEERFLPSRPEAAQENPEEPVRGVESGLRVSSLQNGDLLAEGEILKQQAIDATIHHGRPVRRTVSVIGA